MLLDAFESLDKKIFQGRLLHLIPAAEQISTKSIKPKAAEASGSIAWNSLFIRPDMVMKAGAEKYNSDKMTLFDPRSDQLAIKVSLAESNIIEEVKQFLVDQGVNLDVFENFVDKTRSDRVILVKNLPQAASATELRSMFARYGIVQRLVVPPSKVAALIEYLYPNEASNAFKQLAYHNFNGVPLFLEWAPEGAFNQKAASEPPRTEKTPKQQDDQHSSTTIFVKNLNFKTSESALRELFEGGGKIRSVRIASRNGKSLGYGFVEFESCDSVNMSIDKYQHFMLDDHSIQLSVSLKPSTGESVVKSRQQLWHLHGWTRPARSLSFEIYRSRLPRKN